MKRAILCAATLLLASGAWGQTTSTGNLTIETTDPISSSFHYIEIRGENGEMLVQVNLDGTVTFGKNYKPDEAARIFWKAIGDTAPAKQEKKSPCSSNGVVTTCDAPAWMTFDVPPKEFAGWEPPLPKDWLKSGGDGSSCVSPENLGSIFACAGGVLHYYVHHHTCADPKRVLLMSEDKVWHCYLFKEKP